MANSLEIGNPHLDYRAVELAARLPGESKLKGMELKHILKSASRDFLPPKVLTRQVYGFGISVGEWLRIGLKWLVEDVVSRKNVVWVGLLNIDVVRDIYQNQLSGRRDAIPWLWSVFDFQW